MTILVAVLVFTFVMHAAAAPVHALLDIPMEAAGAVDDCCPTAGCPSSHPADGDDPRGCCDKACTVCCAAVSPVMIRNEWLGRPLQQARHDRRPVAAANGLSDGPSIFHPPRA